MIWDFKFIIYLYIYMNISTQFFNFSGVNSNFNDYNTIYFSKNNNKNYFMYNKKNYIKKKIKLNPIKNIKKFNLTTNGFQYTKLQRPLKDDLKIISNLIKESKFDQKTITKILNCKKYSIFKEKLTNFLKKFCLQKNNLGVKNINKTFTHVIAVGSVYRNSLFSKPKYKKKNPERGIANPPINFIHTDKNKNEALTDWLLERKWWVNKFKSYNILPYKYLHDYKFFNKWSNFYEGKYVKVLNIWISLSNSTLNYPLIFCDKYSYNESDYTAVKYKGLVNKDEYSSYATLKYNKNQKYYYYPNMKKFDIVIFESIETPHVAIRLKNSVKYKYRQSLEFRFVLLNIHSKDKDVSFIQK